MHLCTNQFYRKLQIYLERVQHACAALPLIELIGTWSDNMLQHVTTVTNRCILFVSILSFLSLRISGRRRQRSHKMKHLVSVAERKKSGALATNHAPEIGSLTWRPPPTLRFLFCDRNRLCMTPRHKLCNEPARIFLVLFAVVAESGEATGTTQDRI